MTRPSDEEIVKINPMMKQPVMLTMIVLPRENGAVLLRAGIDEVLDAEA